MPYINQTALAGFVQSDDELLADLACMFVQQLTDCKSRLRLALAQQDASSLRETVHQLKSRLGYFYATDLQRQALCLEQLAKEGDLATAGDMVDKLVTGIHEMLDELRSITRLPLCVADED